MRRLTVIISLAAALGSAAFPAPAPQPSEPPEPDYSHAEDVLGADALAETIKLRTSYGLPVDEASINAAARSSAGPEFPFEAAMTPSEIEAMYSMHQTITDVQASTLTIAEEMPGYLTTSIDYRARQMVFAFSDISESERHMLETSAPANFVRIDLRPGVASREIVMAGFHAVVETWRDYFPEIGVEYIDPVFERGVIVIKADADLTDEFMTTWDQFVDTHPTITLELVEQRGSVHAPDAGSVYAPDACTSRENCHSPLKLGVVIRQGSTTGPRCTAASRISIGGDYKILTAGHCSGSAASYWHPGYGLIGNRYGSLLNETNRIDALSIAVVDRQTSLEIYGDPRAHTNYNVPHVGQAICASLGRSSRVDCGTVVDDITGYTLEGMDYEIYGGRHQDIATQKGDSGSPIYFRSSSTHARGIGIHSSGFGAFARMDAIYGAWSSAPAE